MNFRLQLSNYKLHLGFCCLLSTVSCIPFVIQPPGPREYQVQASKEISTEAVKALADAQKEKVVAMRDVGEKIANGKVEAIKTVATEAAKNTKDPEALTNINANAVSAIVQIGKEDRVLREIGIVDGTARAIGGIAREGIGSTETSTMQYGMYAGAQGYIGAQAFPEAVSQIKGIARWGMETLLPIVGGTLGGGGLIGGLLVALRKAARRRQLLIANGKVIEKHGTPELKTELAKAHAGIPADAKKEHGLT